MVLDGIPNCNHRRPSFRVAWFTRPSGASSVYLSSLIAAVISVLAVSKIHLRPSSSKREPVSLNTVLAGFRYIWQHKLILGSISLDLFAVLLGGAVALLPVYAKEILRTGPWGLGILRSAPGVGALLTALLLANRPLRRRAGATMLWCVAVSEPSRLHSVCRAV